MHCAVWLLEFGSFHRAWIWDIVLQGAQAQNPCPTTQKYSGCEKFEQEDMSMYILSGKT